MQDQSLTLVVSGERYGERNQSPPLSPVEAFYRYRGMLMLGYNSIAITCSDSGEMFESDGFAPESTLER